MDSSPDPNRFSSPSSSQDFPTFVNYGRNFSPNQSAFISPSQRSDIVGQEFSGYGYKENQEVDSESPNLGHILAHDPYLTNSRISYPQPRLTSDENNLSLTSSSLIRSHNYLSQFGSRISNADHVSGPSQVQGTFQHHHRARRALQFGAPPYEELTNDMTSNSLRGLSQEDAYVSDSANLTTSSRLVSSNIATNSSMSQLANFVQTVSTSPDVYWNSLEEALVHDRNNDFANDSDFGSILAVDGENCPLPNNDHSPKIEDSNASSGSIDVAEPFSSPMQVTHVEHQMVPWNGGMPLPPDANGVEELNQVHSKRKRENAPNKDEKGKRCNCKNSKCLKLYCECFASGVYCFDSCGCQNCQNRPDYEDTVLVKRSEIESRNPLAFVPKVTYERTGSPTNTMEVETWTTPSSARHRRGCNCKNSKCSKKYCECYQGNVGCSINCRCHDCQNLFGRRNVWPLTELMHGRVVPSHGIMDLMGETEFNISGNGIANQFPSLEGHYDSNHYAPSSQPSIIRSNSPNMPSLQWYPASQVQPLATSSPDSNHSPGGLSSPRLLENKASLDHYGSVQDFMVGIEIVPEETSPPSKAVQVSSPNQNHAPVPARFGVDGLSSGASSPPVSAPDCKPMSTTVPSSSTFAAICPPANGVYQMGGDPKS